MLEGELRLPFLLSTLMEEPENEHLKDYLARNVHWHLGSNGHGHSWPCYAWKAEDHIDDKNLIYWIRHGFCPIWMLILKKK